MTAAFILGITSGLGAIEIIIVLFLIGIAIIMLPKIFYLITLQNTMKLVRPENREMTPGQAWLELIPVFNLVWQFFNVIYVSNSIKKEMVSRNMPLTEDRPAYTIGITYCILIACSVVPVLGGFAATAGIVCWIIFWVKVAGYKRLLELNAPASTGQAFTHQNPHATGV